jgi:hypothetical protein
LYTLEDVLHKYLIIRDINTLLDIFFYNTYFEIYSDNNDEDNENLYLDFLGKSNKIITISYIEIVFEKFYNFIDNPHSNDYYTNLIIMDFIHNNAKIDNDKIMSHLDKIKSHMDYIYNLYTSIKNYYNTLKEPKLKKIINYYVNSKEIVLSKQKIDLLLVDENFCKN